MGFEDFLDAAVKRKIYAVILGILYVFISYTTASLFFPNSISIAIIILTSLLFVPTLSGLLLQEESVERKEGLQHFFRNHAMLVEVFLFLFIGVFIAYLILGAYAPQAIEYQTKILSEQGATFQMPSNPVQQFMAIAMNNIGVIVIAFVLSLFYGAGALFLITRTASVFASFIIAFSRTTHQQIAVSSLVFTLHFIPEILGFLLAAISGGVISKAIAKEKLGSQAFRNVAQDSSLLLVMSIVLIILAALIESFITPQLAHLLI